MFLTGLGRRGGREVGQEVGHVRPDGRHRRLGLQDVRGRCVTTASVSSVGTLSKKQSSLGGIDQSTISTSRNPVLNAGRR
jgi:hypothetical protein